MTQQELEIRMKALDIALAYFVPNATDGVDELIFVAKKLEAFLGGK